MPAKYSHIKKRPPVAPKNSKKGNNSTGNSPKHTHNRRHDTPNPHGDRSLTQAKSAVSELERAIARILLLRYEQDIARLFSTRLHHISVVYIPTFVMKCVTLAGPGWAAHNADSEEIKDFFRTVIGMDLRQAGERVATKSLLWSYTALRHFAMSNGVAICQKKGLHSMRLLPYISGIKAHLAALESMASPTLLKPPHLGGFAAGQHTLEEACQTKYARWSEIPLEWREESDWRPKVRLGYDKIVQTLWRVAKEFDIRGYGQILRDKLSNKWCECGCSTDHLGDVCEKTVREHEEESGVRSGKHREWDGRGSGIFGWETDEEEDIWELELDFRGIDPSMTIGEIMEWRFLRAEHEKEQGNIAFRRAMFDTAITHYEAAHKIEPELPHFQLNIAAAYLKLSKWIEAEEACSKALSQHRSSKGLFRRAKARQMLGKTDDAMKDLRTILRFQPSNRDAQSELMALLPPNTAPPLPASSSSSDDQQYLEHLHDDVPLWEHHREVTEKGKQKLTMTMKTELTDREKEMQRLRKSNMAFPGGISMLLRRFDRR
ncbi:hypothetical protein BDZ89DRAFT_1074502 [Hymenopellis radicata]|nr:hypothetical protein BDZ89DRAFT_1074502 [Hymenopellis radicata]